MSTPPNSPPAPTYAGHTLLEVLLIDAIESAAGEASGRLRLTRNLHHHATRALFAGTESVPSGELMRVIRGEVYKAARGSTRDVRYFRDPQDKHGNAKPERTLKIDRVRQIVINLLTSGHVSNADAVRAWTYCMIQEAARVVVAEARKRLDGYIDVVTVHAKPQLANDLLNRCDTVLVEGLHKRFERSTAMLGQQRPLAEENRFLDYATMLMVDAMHERISPWKALGKLLKNVYPALDNYEFGFPEDT